MLEREFTSNFLTHPVADPYSAGLIHDYPTTARSAELESIHKSEVRSLWTTTTPPLTTKTHSIRIEDSMFKPFDSRAPNLSYIVLLRAFGWVIRIHKINEPDLPRFHSHPANAFRLILRGGYVEQTLDGTLHTLKPGYAGIVRHDFFHRIVSLTKGPSYSLWIRGPKRYEPEVKI